MSTNFVQSGETVTFTAGADYSSGDVVVLGNMLGVVVADVANGGTGVANVEGVFNLPKLDAAVIAQGEAVAWDVSAGAIDDGSITPAAGDITLAGIAWEAKGATTGDSIAVKLNVSGGVVN